MIQYGLAFNPDWVINVHRESNRMPDHAEVADFVARQTRERGVTAWVCAADHQAYQLIRDLRDRGVSVPHDCSVTGFDGIPPPPGLPQLTTLRVAHADIGGSALARVINRVLHSTSPRRNILVEASVIDGETIVSPPSS